MRLTKLSITEATRKRTISVGEFLSLPDAYERFRKAAFDRSFNPLEVDEEVVAAKPVPQDRPVGVMDLDTDSKWDTGSSQYYILEHGLKNAGKFKEFFKYVFANPWISEPHVGHVSAPIEHDLETTIYEIFGGDKATWARYLEWYPNAKIELATKSSGYYSEQCEWALMMIDYFPKLDWASVLAKAREYEIQSIPPELYAAAHKHTGEGKLLYIFTAADDEGDWLEGVTIEADNNKEAVTRFMTMQINSSDDINDYVDDINRGNIRVEIIDGKKRVELDEFTI